jgi:putative DNA primase/helicase
LRLNAALAYARHGWLVFPSHSVDDGRCSCGRADCEHPGKHPRTAHGVKDATTDKAVIRAWWTAHPEANVSVATGPVSGLVVIDVDPRHGGSLDFASVNGKDPIPWTPRSVTGGGGWHLLLAYPNFEVGNKTGLFPGIDVKGAGGSFVAPPSIHASGARYQWEIRPRLVPLAPLPVWLAEMLKPKPAPARPVSLPLPDDLKERQRELERQCRYAAKALANEALAVAGEPEGGRNDRLNAAAIKLGGFVASKLLVRDLVDRELLQAALRAGLPAREAEATIRSGLDYGIAQGPRDIPPPKSSEGTALRSGSSTIADPGASSEADFTAPGRKAAFAPIAAVAEAFRGLDKPAKREAVVAALRSLATSAAGCDPIDRTATRHEAVERLKELGVVDREAGALVAAALKESREAAGTSLQGAALNLRDPAEWSEPIDGAALASEIADTFSRYVALPPHAADALALWTLHAHAHDAAEVSPILVLVSPTKRCGKTTTLLVLSALVPRPVLASNLTPATLFRTVERWRPTLLVDEGDALKDNEDLRLVLNAGHVKATAGVPRCEGDAHEPRLFSTWAPKALALIGRPPDTIEDRGVVVRMQRRGPRQTVARLRLDRLHEREPLRRQAWSWARQHLAAIAAAEPVVPDGLHDRAADNWRVLCALADALGGEWPARAAAASLALSGAESADEGTGVLLLGDLRDLFHPVIPDRDSPDDRSKATPLDPLDLMSSVEIVEALGGLDDRPWGEWGSSRTRITARGVARLLKPFGIVPKDLRFPDGVRKGYRRAVLEDAWEHYLDPDPPSIRNIRDSRENSGPNLLFHPQQTGHLLRIEGGVKSAPDTAVADVADTDPLLRACRLCQGVDFWRHKNGGPLVCSTCHPPQPDSLVWEWRSTAPVVGRADA